ncbi:MAG: hypothetical protein NZM07_02395 [Elioraea sp.]|nr:hypothetical protein [Elioraea sp.]
MDGAEQRRTAPGVGETERRILDAMARAIAAVLVLVLASGFAFAAARHGIVAGLRFLGGAALVRLAAFSVGALGGFLFGLPRRAGEQGRPAAAEGAAASAQDARPTGFLASDNLTRIAEWLTTILVGIGLVQAKEVAAGLSAVTDAVARELLPGNEGGTALAAAVLVLGVVPGVLAGYLLTTLVLAGRIVSAALGLEQRIRAEERARFEQERLAFAFRDAVRAEWRRRPIDPLLPGRDGAWPAPLKLSEAEAFVAALDLAEVGDDPDLVRAWAKLQLAVRRLDRAIEGFRRAAELRPDVAEFRNEFASVLLAARTLAERRPPGTDAAPPPAPLETLAAAESAVRLTESPVQALQAAPAVRFRALKNAAVAALYVPPPDGYRRARDAVAKAEREFGELASNDPDFQLWKACALGQEHRDRLQRGEPAEALAGLVHEAEEAVHLALRLRPEAPWRDWIRQLADRAYRESKGGRPDEDDLETIFEASPRLRKLLTEMA